MQKSCKKNHSADITMVEGDEVRILEITLPMRKVRNIWHRDGWSNQRSTSSSLKMMKYSRSNVQRER